MSRYFRVWVYIANSHVYFGRNEKTLYRYTAQGPGEKLLARLTPRPRNQSGRFASGDPGCTSRPTGQGISPPVTGLVTACYELVSTYCVLRVSEYLLGRSMLRPHNVVRKIRCVAPTWGIGNVVQAPHTVRSYITVCPHIRSTRSTRSICLRGPRSYTDVSTYIDR